VLAVRPTLEVLVEADPRIRRARPELALVLDRWAPGPQVGRLGQRPCTALAQVAATSASTFPDGVRLAGVVTSGSREGPMPAIPIEGPWIVECHASSSPQTSCQ
jgi:hypothetical protein